MDAAALIRTARHRAGLSQRELGRRARTSQAAIARYESGAVDPTLRTLQRLIRACHGRLEVALVIEEPPSTIDADLRAEIRWMRQRAPEQRLDDLGAADDLVRNARRRA